MFGKGQDVNLWFVWVFSLLMFQDLEMDRSVSINLL